jgi:MFS transporter, AAHS family, 4-hydroxybenzoate transporter
MTNGPVRGAARVGERQHVLVTWLCGLVLTLEGYDFASVGYAVPSLMDAWHIKPVAFTSVLTAGNVGLLLGALIAGPIGDRIGRRPVLIGWVATFGLFSLLSAFSGSPADLAWLRFGTGLGLGGGVPLAIALASDHAPEGAQGRLVILMSSGVSIGNTVGGLLATQIVRFLGWPWIFVVGGVLPLIVVIVLVGWLPESEALRLDRAPGNRVAALFRAGRAPSTLLLWVMNLLNLLNNYLILLWLPAILRADGVAPSWAIFAATMYALGTIVGAYVTAPVVDRIGVERVLTCLLFVGALCVFTIGTFNPPFRLLAAIIGVSGIGIGGCQHGINALNGRIYPPAIRSTGAGWATGSGRVGTIAGPSVGGLFLGLGWSGQQIILFATAPALGVTAAMAGLGVAQRRMSRGNQAVGVGD